MKKISFVAVAFFVLSCSSTKKTTSSNLPSVQDWNIGLQLWTFRLFSFHDAIAKADSCGIKYVQAFPGQDLGGSWTGKFDPSMTAEQRSAVKDYVKSKGVIMNSYGVTGADNEAEWKKLFDFAKDMGIS